MEEGIKVLYVDDEPGLLEIGRIFLERSGDFHVSTATSAQDALGSPEIPSYDAIISDYLMPGMDGIAFLKAVRNQHGDIPFVLFTGRGREEVVIEAINNGADFYLQKGGDPTAQFAELSHKIRQAVLRKRAEHSRMKAERDLRESEEKYRSLVDLVPDAVLVHREGTVVYVNPECVRLVGAASPDDVIGKNMLPFIHPDDRPMALEHLRLMREKGVTIPLVEERLMRLDGRPFTVEVTARPVTYQGLPSVIVVFRDITDRKKKEDELSGAYEQIAAAEEELRGQYEELARGERLIRESEEKYRSLIDLVPMAVLVHREGRIVYANPECVRLAGASRPEDLTGREILPLIHPDDRPIAQEYFRQVNSGATIPLTEMRLFRIDGQPFTVEAAGKQITFGGVPSVIIVYRDITDRKKKEDELRAAYEQLAASEEELRGQYGELALAQTKILESQDALFGSRQMLQVVLDSIPQRVFWKDRNSVFLGCNMPLARDAGFSDPAMLVGKTDYDHASHATADLYRADDRQVMETGQSRINYEEPQVRPDGSHAWLRTTKVPLRDREGTIIGVLGTYEDITGQKQAQEDLQKSEERNRRILAQAPLPLAFVRNDGVITFVNNRFVRIFGYTTEDIPDLETWWQKAYPDPDYRQQVRERWEDAVSQSLTEHADITPAEYRVTCKNGEERILEISGIALSDGFLATFTDQTERKRMEEALLKKTEELDRFFTLSMDLFCIAGTDGIFRRLNPEWERTLGYTLAELEGRRFPDFVHPDDLPATLAAVADLAEQKTVLNFTNRFRHRNGTYRWIEWRSYPSGDTIFAAARDITERKSMEEALRESEELLRLLIRQAPAALAMFDREMRYLAASHRWMADYRLGGREIIGRSHYEVFPEIPEEIKAVHRRCLAGEVVSAAEEKFRRQDGSVQWLTWEVRPWYTAGSAIGGIIIFSEDITRRKIAEEALRESEARLGSILHSSPAPQFVIGSDHRILSWNRALEEYSGFSAAEMIGTDQQWRPFYPNRRPVLADLVVDNNTDGLFKIYAGKLQPSRYVEGAYEAIDFFPAMGATGTWLSFTAAPIRNADGEIIGSVETLEDITGRITATEALRASEEKYRHILENMQDAYIRVDEQGIISMVNPSAVRMYGYGSVEEMIGMPVISLYAGSGQQRDAMFRKLQEAGGITDFAGEALKKDGTIRWVSMNAQYIRDREGRIRGTEGIIRDMTERKAMERAVREANKKLALLGSITRHDIANQLMTLQGFAQIAAKNERDPAIAGFLARINAVAVTIRSQIEFMKTYQDLGVHSPGWSLLRETVTKVAKPEVSFSETCRDIEVFSDPMLERVFFNLFENAIQHGGNVTEIAVRCRKDADALVIIVEDNGSGIPGDEKEKIFEKGFGKNTGLGLFLAREILSITGITIRETGEPGRGARFEMAVPEGAWRISGETQE